MKKQRIASRKAIGLIRKFARSGADACFKCASLNETPCQEFGGPIGFVPARSHDCAPASNAPKSIIDDAVVFIRTPANPPLVAMRG